MKELGWCVSHLSLCTGSPASVRHAQIRGFPRWCKVKTKPIASGVNIGNSQFSPPGLCFTQSVGKFDFCSRKEIASCPPQISCKILIVLFTGFPHVLSLTGLVFSMSMGFPELEKKHCRVLLGTISSLQSAHRVFPRQGRLFMASTILGAS